MPRTMEEMLYTKLCPGKLWKSQYTWYFWHKSKIGHENLSWFTFHLPTDTSCHYHAISTTMYHNLFPFYLSAYSPLLKVLVLLCLLFFLIFCVSVCLIAGINFLGLFKLLIGKVERSIVKAKYTSCLWKHRSSLVSAAYLYTFCMGKGYFSPRKILYSWCLSVKYSTRKMCSWEAAKTALYFEISEPPSFLLSQSRVRSEHLVYFWTVNPRLSVRIRSRTEDAFLPENLCECPLLTTISIMYQRNAD